MGHELRRPEADFLRDGIYELRTSLGVLHHRILYQLGSLLEQRFTRLDEHLFCPIADGVFAGEDCREILKPAITWWKSQLNSFEATGRATGNLAWEAQQTAASPQRPTPIASGNGSP